MLKLNIKKVEKERLRLGLTKSELANKMGISKQLLNYTMKNEQVFHAHLFAKVFDLEPRDLIK